MARPSTTRRFRLSTTIVAVACLIPVLFGLPLASAQQATPVASVSDTEAIGELPPAWLEFGPQGSLLARVIVAGECPPLIVDDLQVAMSPRTSPSSAFPVGACAATIPFGSGSASIQNQALPVPDGPFTRIAVIGDTGCRLDDWEGHGTYQACNDPQAWPFAQVAASVAAWQPDLIIHVGDYLYRESACPAGMTGCAGSPHGDNWATWNADFFTPAASLLGAAPWVLMRGNHEMCERNPEGWFAYLDPRAYQPTCQKFTEPYVAPLLGLTIAVIDSAEASDTSVTAEEQTEYKRQFDLLGQMAPDGSWLVTHRPVWGILEGSRAEFEVENASYHAATGDSLGGDYALVLSGHIHLAESLAFDPASGRPAQLISGNAGTALDDIPTASPTAGQLGDPSIQEAETLSAFGFLTLERVSETWVATQRDAAATPMLRCLLELPEMACIRTDGAD